MADEQSLTEAQLVVIGASAGGIEALSTLVGSLPEDFPAPIVIAQHLDPRRQSHLEEILARRCSLPVRTVTDHELLAPGVVFVVPANRHVQISDHEVAVRGDGAEGPMPSVDLLLSTAAESFGERLIAVILTGSGSDGTAGARDVKRAGGTVVAQDPRTASFRGMPGSLAPTTVDIVADLDAIGPLLVDLVRGAYLPVQRGDERLLQIVMDELRERSGIDFSKYKQPTILRRLQRRMVATDTHSLRDYVRHMERNPDEYQRLASSFLIKVTEFFRDAELFAYLREQTLPALIQEARENGRELRLWSAGCATGEEAYSLAILVTELLGDAPPDFNVRIFATDLDDDAITFARNGTYLPAAVATLPPDQLERHFVAIDGGYEVKKAVRSLVIFGQHDLGQRAPFPRIDLVLCRNVLIYFTAELQRRSLHLFAFALREGGLLALGKAETTSPLSENFALQDSRLKIYRRYGDAVLMPPTQIRAAPPRPLRLLPSSRVSRSLAAASSPSPMLAGRSIAGGERLDRTLADLPTGVVVVDRRYDIQYVNTAARRSLGIYQAAIGEDLLHLVPVDIVSVLRDAIDSALRGEAVTLDAVEVESPVESAPRCLQIECSPRREQPNGETGQAVVISVSDTTGVVQRLTRLGQERTSLQAELDRERGEHRKELERLTRKTRLLSERNQQLLEANEELLQVNAELADSRDAFLIGNEEAQAAIEEIETLNEEMQASNEELETLNEEMQATVEELNTTNDDLEARTTELQELATRLEQERARLDAILLSMSDAVLVFERDGAAVRTNEAYDQLVAGGGTFEAPDGSPLAEELLPERRAARGESFSMQLTRRDPDGSRRWFEAIGRPVRSDGERLVVVVLREITARS